MSVYYLAITIVTTTIEKLQYYKFYSTCSIVVVQYYMYSKLSLNSLGYNILLVSSTIIIRSVVFVFTITIKNIPKSYTIMNIRVFLVWLWKLSLNIFLFLSHLTTFTVTNGLIISFRLIMIFQWRKSDIVYHRRYTLS